MGLFRKKNTNEEEQEEEINENLWDTSDITRLIEDEKIPLIKDHSGNVVFQRDINNRRIVLSNYILKIMNKKNILKECINYFKVKDTIDYITLYEHTMTNNCMVNMYIKGSDTYYVPFRFIDDEGSISDDEIHYTKEAVNIEEKKGTSAYNEDFVNLNNTKFYSIKDPKTGNKYLPLFTSENELRKIFSEDEYRICIVSYKEAVMFANQYLGLVFRPTEESFIVSNEIAGYFTAITPYIKPKTNYKEFTQGSGSIKDKIKKLHNMKVNNPAFNDYYKGLIQEIADVENIYIALSHKAFNNKTGTSVPFVGDKEGKTTMYIFTDFEAAERWTHHYGNFSRGGIPLIGEINKDQNYDSLFSIARKMGIDLCSVNDENDVMIFSIKMFIDINHLSQNIRFRIPEDVMNKNILSKNKHKVQLKFNDIPVLGMERLSSNIKYEIVNVN